MVEDKQFDVIVVGAGLAGLCCAGELVLLGARPLLVCETHEVGSTLRSLEVGKSQGFVQNLLVSAGIDSWWQLARRLNVPVRAFRGAGFAIVPEGSNQAVSLPFFPSAAGFVRVVDEFFPLGDSRDNLERVTMAGLAIPWSTLMKMDRTPLAEWLEDEKADPLVSHLLLTLCGSLSGLSVDEAREFLSALGGWAALRYLLCQEGTATIPYPDPRQGLCVPLAREIEGRQGRVWRGRRVHRVLIERDKVAGIVLEDGTEVRARNVALACANSRISSLFDSVPPEVEHSVTYTARLDAHEFTGYSVLDEAVWKPDHSYLALISPAGGLMQWSWPLSNLAPWTAEPGKQLVATEVIFSSSQKVAEAGGEDAIYATMRDRNEAICEGYRDVLVEFGGHSHRHLWHNQISVGPKLPRRSESTQGLWFVNDGSVPIGGIFTDAAATAGILGARAIAAARHG